MAAQRWQIGKVAVTRVCYFDIGLPPDAVELAQADLDALRSAGADLDRWLDADGQPMVGQSIWVVESHGQTIVVDPCSASDDFLRSGAEAVVHQEAAFAAFTEAGFDRDTVDLVLMSHLDGIGMIAWLEDDQWVPAFPNAEIVLGARERQAIIDYAETTSGAKIFEQIAAVANMSVHELPHQLTPEIGLTFTGVHSGGHLVATISSDGQHAAFWGHLAITPIHLMDGVANTAHVEPDNVPALLDEWLDWAQANDAVVFGPLWPSPGAVRVTKRSPLAFEGVAG